MRNAEKMGEPGNGFGSLKGAAFLAWVFCLGLLFTGPVFAATVQLAWDPVQHPQVASYQVHYGPKSGQYTKFVETVTNAAGIQGLQPGSKYYFAVRACNKDKTNCSAFSNEVNTTISSSGTVPVASFTTNTVAGFAPLTVLFTDNSTGDITTRDWQFGDGDGAEDFTLLSHTYSTPGTYTPQLSVTGLGGADSFVAGTPITVYAPDDSERGFPADDALENADDTPIDEQPLTDDDPMLEDEGSAFSIAPGITGSWYNPARSGEGFRIEVLEARGGGLSLVVYFYTYDDARNQVWVGGVGPVTGNTATVPVQLTSGASFGPDFDPADVDRQDWGTLTFEFASCNSGSVMYDSTMADFGSGAFDIERLTAIPGLPCDLADADYIPWDEGITPGISGSWYDPSRSGEGFNLEVLETQQGAYLVAYFYTYDDAGNQAWVGGLGPITGDTATVPVQVTSGAFFGPDFDPADVDRRDWGTLTFEFTSCTSGYVDYDSFLTEFGWGTFDIERLTAIPGLACR